MSFYLKPMATRTKKKGYRISCYDINSSFGRPLPLSRRQTMFFIALGKSELLQKGLVLPHHVYTLQHFLSPSALFVPLANCRYLTAPTLF
jgi:hypothetical protein